MLACSCLHKMLHYEYDYASIVTLYSVFALNVPCRVIGWIVILNKDIVCCSVVKHRH